jgi:hypothetical protein
MGTVLGACETCIQITLWQECAIPPICIASAGHHTHAFFKCCLLNTWATKLVANPLHTKKQIWSTNTQWWLHYYQNMVHTDHPLGSFCRWEDMDLSVLSFWVAFCVCQWVMKLHSKLPCAHCYILPCYNKNNLAKPHIGYNPKINIGLSHIACAWGNMLPTQRQLAPTGLNWNRPLLPCPFCSTGQVETVPHLLIACLW